MYTWFAKSQIWKLRGTNLIDTITYRQKKRKTAKLSTSLYSREEINWFDVGGTLFSERELNWSIVLNMSMSLITLLQNKSNLPVVVREWWLG